MDFENLENIQLSSFSFFYTCPTCGGDGEVKEYSRYENQSDPQTGEYVKCPECYGAGIAEATISSKDFKTWDEFDDCFIDFINSLTVKA